MPTARAKLQRTQFFSSTLVLLLERNAIKQVELAAASGIAVSRVNNYLQGKYRTIRPDHLASIADVAGRTPAQRGELARAYVMDLLPEKLHGAIGLGMAGAGSSRPAFSEKSLLPATAREALATLQALGVRSAKARSRMQWFAEILAEAHGK
jgi:transcriptional regulator with XRE-family HTH domain